MRAYRQLLNEETRAKIRGSSQKRELSLLKIQLEQSGTGTVSNRSLADFDAELEQLPVDAGRSPVLAQKSIWRDPG